MQLMDLFKGKLTDRKVILIILIGVLAVFLIKKIGITDEVQAVVGVASLLAGYFGNKVQKKDKTKADQIRDYLDNKHHISPEIAILYIIGYMQLSQKMLAGIIENIISGIHPFTQDDLAVMNSSIIYASMLFIIPITIYVSHRLKKNAPIWMLIGTYLNQIFIVTINAIFAYSIIIKPVLASKSLAMFLFANLGITIASLVPGIILGYIWAKKTQLQFVLDQLFRKLPTDEQKQLVELTRLLPSVAEKNE